MFKSSQVAMTPAPAGPGHELRVGFSPAAAAAAAAAMARRRHEPKPQSKPWLALTNPPAPRRPGPRPGQGFVAASVTESRAGFRRSLSLSPQARGAAFSLRPQADGPASGGLPPQ